MLHPVFAPPRTSPLATNTTNSPPGQIDVDPKVDVWVLQIQWAILDVDHKLENMGSVL